MKYLLIGRSGSGKNALARELSKLGLSVLRTYTTRPPRTKTDTEHHYITETDAANLPNHIAETRINGHRYFITNDLFDETNPDVIIIEPKGAKELTAHYPDISFHIVHLETTNADLCRQHAINRADDTTIEEQIYNDKRKDEDHLFTDFETFKKKLEQNPNAQAFAPNTIAIHSIINDYNIETLQAFAAQLVRKWTLFNNIKKITNQCLLLNILDSKKEGTITIYLKDTHTDGEPIQKTVSQDYFVDMLLANPDNFNTLLESWLSSPVTTFGQLAFV